MIRRVRPSVAGPVIAALCLAVGNPTAMAQTVAVRSGDHDGFARLVLDFPATPQWQLGRAGDGYRLSTGAAYDYDLGRVYDLITRERIASVDPDGSGGLRIALGCTCHAQAFDYAGNRVVIDILDGPAPPDSPFERPEDPASADAAPVPDMQDPAPAPAAADVMQADRPGPPAGTTPPVAGLELLLAPRVDGNLFAALPLVPPEPPPAPASEQADAAPSPADALRSALAEQIGRAMAQGLIEPNLDPLPDLHRLTVPAPEPSSGHRSDAPASDTPVPATPDDAPPDTADPSPPADNPNVAVTGPGAGQVDIRTAVDRERPPAPDDRTPDASGRICTAAAEFDLPAWGDPDAQRPDFGMFRTRMTGEFDRADRSAILEAARNYAYYGFGAEVRGLLRSFEIPQSESPVLVAISRVLDGESGGAVADALGPELECDTPGALWAAMALERLPRGADYDRAALSQAFSALPAHLRSLLGPTVIERLLDAGDRETADTIRRAMNRAGSTGTDAAALVDAEFDTLDGRPDRAEARLRAVAGQAGQAEPEALAELIERAVARGELLDEGTILSAAGVAFELRGDPVGQRLKRAELLARLQQDAFATVLDEAGRTGTDGALAPEARNEVISAAVAALAERGPDTLFLERVGSTGAAAFPLTDHARRAVARRLADLGLWRQAIAAAAPLPDGPDTALLRAQAYLAGGQDRQALLALAGLNEPAALRLKAEALTGLGRFGAAADLYSQLGDDAASARAALRARDLARVADLDASPYRALAALAVAPPGPEAEARTLGDNKSLLAEAERVRTAVEQILAPD